MLESFCSYASCFAQVFLVVLIKIFIRNDHTNNGSHTNSSNRTQSTNIKMILVLEIILVIIMKKK